MVCAALSALYQLIVGMYSFVPYCAAAFMFYFILHKINQQNYLRLAYALTNFGGLLFLFFFDDGIGGKTGYYFFYVPILTTNYLFYRANNNKLDYLIAIVVTIVAFFWVNFLPSPKMGANEVGASSFYYYLFNFMMAASLVFYGTRNFINEVIKKDIELNKNRAEMNALLENTSNQIWCIDSEFNLISANSSFIKTFHRKFGFGPEFGKNIFNNLPIEEKAIWTALYNRALKGEVFSAEKQYELEGSLYTFEFSFNPIKQNDVVTGITINSTDITSHKEYELSIIEREKNMQNIVDSIDDMIVEFDENLRYTNVWASDESMLNHDRRYYIGKTIGEAVSYRFAQPFEAMIEKAFATGETSKYEYQHTVKGHLNWYCAKVRLVKSTSSRRVIMSIENISERKRQEISTLRQKDFLNTLIENLPVGIFAKDVKKDMKYVLWNHELEKMFGIKEYDVLGKTDLDIFDRNEEIDDYVDTDHLVVESREPLLLSNLNVNTGQGVLVTKTIKIPVFDTDGKPDLIIGIIENVTDIKQAQDELINAERRWNYALTGSRDGVWDLDLNTGKIFYSATFIKMLGYAEGEFEQSTKAWEENIHPDDLNRVLQDFTLHIQGKIDFYQNEHRKKRKDGSYTWVLDRGRIAEYDTHGKPSRFIGTVTDITARKELEQKAITTETLLESISQNINEAIYRSTPTKGLVYVNRAFIEMFGYTSYENVLSLETEHFYVDPESRLRMLREVNERGFVYNMEVQFKKRDGSIFWGLLSTIKNTNSDGEVFYDGAIRDITEIKIIEEQLINAKEQAEEAAKAKSLFLSTMSHEIRTPMNAVIGIANLLLQERHLEQQLENLRTLKFSAESLMYLLNDILDFSKIDAGKIELESTEFNLAQLLVNIKQSSAVKAEEKGIKLDLLIDPQLPETITGDPVRIAQILNNLVSNAIKFTEDGVVQVQAKIIESNLNTTQIYFEVSDTGIGINEAKLPTIFEQFMQASSDTTRKYGGTGLGLAITKKLIELFESEIFVESEVGVGSRFFFTLRLQNSEQHRKLIEAEKRLSEFEKLNGMRVLLVEDNKVNTFVAARFLSNWGISYDTAENGMEALELLKSNKYDLILMDLQMPEMDGYDCTVEIRKSGDKTPIFALTANAFSDIKSKVLHSGMNDYITKPFDPDELYKKIKAVRPQNLPSHLSLFDSQ